MGRARRFFLLFLGPTGRPCRTGCGNGTKSPWKWSIGCALQLTPVSLSPICLRLQPASISLPVSVALLSTSADFFLARTFPLIVSNATYSPENCGRPSWGMRSTRYVSTPRCAPSAEGALFLGKSIIPQSIVMWSVLIQDGSQVRLSCNTFHKGDWDESTWANEVVNPICWSSDSKRFCVGLQLLFCLSQAPLCLFSRLSLLLKLTS